MKIKPLCYILILALLVLAGFSLTPGSAVMGMEQPQAQAEGYWQLVQTLEEPGDSSFNASYHGELCSTHTVSWSNGMVSDSVNWPKTTSPDRYSYCENTRDMSYSGSASWTPPPQVIHPGDELNLNGQVTIHDRDTVWPAGVNWSVGYNTTHVCSTGSTEGTKFCDNQTFTVRTGNPGSEYAIGVTVVVTPGLISPGGERMNSTGRYRYVYEWVAAEEKPADPTPIPEPTPTQEPEFLYNLGGEIKVLNPMALRSSNPVDFETYWPLINVKVYLIHSGNVIDQTFTSLEGLFGFQNVSVTEDLVVKVELEHAIHAPDETPYFKVVYQELGNLVSFSTQPFEVDPEEGKWELISILVDLTHELEYEPTAMQHHELMDAALTFYYLDQAWHFAALRLGLGKSLDLPFEARIYSTERGAYWSGPIIYSELDGSGSKTTQTIERPTTFINMAPEYSRFFEYNHSGVLLHEFGHHLMADVFDNYLPWNIKMDKNHHGFTNPTTNDSWMEGFANFVAAWIQRDMLEVDNPHVVYLTHHNYQNNKTTQGAYNLESNRLAWSLGTGEGFAVASLLWDLIDPINPGDCTVFPMFGYATQPVITAAPDQVFTRYCDHVQLTNDQLWEILTSNHLPSDSPFSPDNYDWIWDMKDLYRNLKFSYGYYSVENNTPELTPNQMDPIDELFISHGFFADVSPQNLAYDPGETIGMTSNEPLTVGDDSFPARQVRRVPPPAAESYIGYRLYDVSSGSFIPQEIGDFFLVEIFFEPPFELYNYSFETRAGSVGELYYFGPPGHYAATTRISAIGPGREPVNVLEFSNAFYWQEGYMRGDEVFIEHVFEVQQQRGSGGGGWILPAVLTSTITLICAGLIILLGVVIVIVVKRRQPVD